MKTYLKGIRYLIISCAWLSSTSAIGQFTTQNGTKDIDGFYNWNDADNWVSSSQPSPLTTLINDEIVVNGYISTSGGLTFDNIGANSDEIVVNDTLVVYGDVFFDNNAISLVNNGVLIVFGNFRSDNKADIDNGGIMVVTGNLTMNGGQQDYVDSNGGSGGLYVGGTIGGTSTDAVANATPDEETNLSNFSPEIEEFVLGSGSFPLPVELISFETSVSHTGVSLAWKTATEINNDYFSIERSENGSDFYEIGIIDGNGTTNEPQVYKFVDKAPIAPIEYYRLKQVDFDGGFEYHKTIVGYTDKLASRIEMSTFPNPAVEKLTFKSNHPIQFNQLELVNLSGQIVANLNKSVDHLGLEIDVTLPPLNKGLYYVKYRTLSGEKGSKKLIIR